MFKVDVMPSGAAFAPVTLLYLPAATIAAHAFNMAGLSMVSSCSSVTPAWVYRQA